MEIIEAQRDVRNTFVGGFPGQLVSSAVWFVSAISMTWFSFKAGVLVLVVGGIFIFPLAQLMLRLMGLPHSLPKGHPMNPLGMQVAFVLPFSIPLVFTSIAYRHSWFYPAFMIILGAHYLPFIFMYGMRMFAVLAGLLIAVGVFLGLYLPTAPVLGCWLTALLLFTFAWIGRHTALTELSESVGTRQR